MLTGFGRIHYAVIISRLYLVPSQPTEMFSQVVGYRFLTLLNYFISSLFFFERIIAVWFEFDWHSWKRYLCVLNVKSTMTYFKKVFTSYCILSHHKSILDFSNQATLKDEIWNQIFTSVGEDRKKMRSVRFSSSCLPPDLSDGSWRKITAYNYKKKESWEEGAARLQR